ncbi:hypothetical protein ABGB14_23795 [Nonomuraea sp. B10E15]|uniref:hypothetical protein n=1 Tax=Nonomuraea sp. B10E15 TaxID=3153560 RepID=UPI00325E663A
MLRSINHLADRLLDRVLPSTTANAETCWYEYPSPFYRLRCCIVAGRTYCNPA